MFDLVEMQRQRELLLTEAQRLVRIQPEIAHGFHRQVETNLIVRSSIAIPNRPGRRSDWMSGEISRRHIQR